MLSRLGRLLFCLPLGFFLSAAQGQSSTLYAEGLLRVRGADWRDARVTLIPEFGDPFEVPLSSDHFELDLGLESSYLVRASHEGCATKEVIFDLRVPVQNRNQVFRFPFEILLEVFKPNQEPYAYAHPVGAVFFDPIKQDFTYTTDHQRIRQARSIDPLMERMETHINLHPHPENALAGYEALFDEDPNAWSLPAKAAVKAPAMLDTVTTDAVMESSAITELPPPKMEPIANSKPAVPSPVLVESTIRAARTNDPPKTARPSELPKPTPAVDAPPSESRVSTRFALEPSSAQQAMHEFHELPTMFIQIDRFSNSEITTELRKVTHAYGAVFYFQDGITITKRAYTEELAKRMNATGTVGTQTPGRP